MLKERKRCEVYNRDKFGRFIEINGNTKYKIKQINGKHKGEHVLVWEKHNKKTVPAGFVIHHIDRNTKNNNIENLKCLTYLEHNGLHAHPAWNKGIKAPQISHAKMGHCVSIKQINKVKTTWFNKYLNSNIKIWELKDNNYSIRNIAKKLNLTVDQVNNRWKGFNKVFNTNNMLLK